MISAQSNLTMVGLNTPSPQVFWKGIVIQNIIRIRTDWEADEQRISIKLAPLGVNVTAINEMRAAGIVVKEI